MPEAEYLEERPHLILLTSLYLSTAATTLYMNTNEVMQSIRTTTATTC